MDVIFDIDGTLVNSASFEDDCYLKAIQEVIEMPVDADWSKYKNVTDPGILDEIIERTDLLNDRINIHKKVKRRFFGYIKTHLSHTPAKEIKGASAFIQKLNKRNDLVLAIATGGWEESAKMKLESAGINYSGIAFSSGSDHISRAGIMKIAESKCSLLEFTSKSYFGDAIWDKKASHELGYNFILVGNQFSYSKKILDFSFSDEALAFVGLY